MPASLVQGDSLLAVDVGAATTRAVFFDVVEGEYRFLAASSAPSTAEAPFKDLIEGVRDAITRLQSVTGRTLLDGNSQLITPSQPDGSGVDAFVSTLSAGPALKTVIIGLLSDVSLESARRLAETTYARIIDSIGLNDHRKPDQQIDTLLRLRPDMVIITGGADGGASRSIHKTLEPAGLAGYLLAPEKRPAVLFAGNQKLDDEVKEMLGSVTSELHFSPNVRPSLDTEDIEPAARQLADLVIGVRRRQLKGVDVLQAWSGGRVLPTAYAEGRMLRFLGQVYGGTKGGILGVDLGASAAVIAAGFKDKTVLGVYPQFGLGENLPALLQYTQLEDILRWLPLDISTGTLRDYLFQKSLYPASIPATKEDQTIAQAVSRQALYLAMQTARRDFPRSARPPKAGLLPLFEPILAGGGALGDAPTPGQSLLLLLDAIQPVGVTTIILDRNNLLPLLGAAAARNSLLPVQVLDSGAFQSLGSVVSVIASASYGELVVRAKLVYDNGTEARTDVKYGSLELIPLATGQSAKLTLQPQRGADVGFGPGRGGTLSVSGGAMGVVIDGRGRPLALPEDSVRRRELIKKWIWTIGG
ncbi:MAG: glutamate mutase L [Chloroflexi bacterium]|nr:glutamate mutase L [Chloroflexota bacterium]MBI3341444.1 glutamate mutase L [Chloroflexota bacterium]